MKTLNTYISMTNEKISSIADIIIEKLKISKKLGYNYFPESRSELRKLIKERVKNEGNDVDLNDIDTSKITNMESLFYSETLEDFNGDISKWNVSNVTSMNHMFCGCKNFNCDLSKWDVSKVKNIRSMFYECYSFEGVGLENWNVSNLEIIEGAFGYCIQLKGKELENWDVSSVKYAIDTFYDCKRLSCNLDNWNMSNCIEMDDMFYGCKNMNIPKWYKK